MRWRSHGHVLNTHRCGAWMHGGGRRLARPGGGPGLPPHPVSLCNPPPIPIPAPSPPLAMPRSQLSIFSSYCMSLFWSPATSATAHAHLRVLMALNCMSLALSSLQLRSGYPPPASYRCVWRGGGFPDHPTCARMSSACPWGFSPVPCVLGVSPLAFPLQHVKLPGSGCCSSVAKPPHDLKHGHPITSPSPLLFACHRPGTAWAGTHVFSAGGSTRSARHATRRSSRCPSCTSCASSWTGPAPPPR